MSAVHKDCGGEVDIIGYDDGEVNGVQYIDWAWKCKTCSKHGWLEDDDVIDSETNERYEL